MALLKELKALFSQLGNPKFVHHFLEPFLFWGLLIGLIAFMLSLWVLKDRKAQLCSLILLAISAFSIFPLMHYRKKAARITAPSREMLNEQTERRKETQWVFYAYGSLALLGMFMTGEGKGKAGTVITLGLIAGGTAVVLYTLWLHEKEVSVFHEDARKSNRMSYLPDPHFMKKWSAHERLS